ncbi:unnamed protein product [Ectocarpus sp. CCAP 1310/34]|nr:unnamed protein product [Ectocarpus sp. CCAP 1310/34]
MGKTSMKGGCSQATTGSAAAAGGTNMLL